MPMVVAVSSTFSAASLCDGPKAQNISKRLDMANTPRVVIRTLFRFPAVTSHEAFPSWANTVTHERVFVCRCIITACNSCSGPTRSHGVTGGRRSVAESKHLCRLLLAMLGFECRAPAIGAAELLPPAQLRVSSVSGRDYALFPGALPSRASTA